MAIVFEFENDVAEQISAYLGELSAKTPSVIANATNSTARKARKLLTASVKKRYTSDAKTKEYTAAMSLSRASTKKLEATLYIKGEPQSLQRFSVDPKQPPSEGSTRPAATKAQVLLAGGTMKMLEVGGVKAFVTSFKSGDVAVVQRTGRYYSYAETVKRSNGSTYTRTDTRHDAVRKLWSVSIPKMVGTELNIGATMRDDIQQILQEELAKQIEKVMRKAGTL